jgi:tetratricopeptide (TPR) repeat protein
MKRIALVLLVTTFFTSCKQNKTELDQSLQHTLNKLDSLGIDISNDTILSEIGYQGVYCGENEKGNALIDYAFSIKDTISAENYRHSSVQNTKNGNYSIAINKLEKAFQINPQETAGYYAWVLLYYYRDYEKSLKILEQLDAYTPNFADAPVGEDIHYLKGLCQMQLLQYQKAIDEFNIYINNITTTLGEDWVDVYTFVHKGRCLTKLDKYEEAINSYDKAIKHYENCTEAYYFKGLTHIKLNKNDEACSNFHLALTLIKKGFKNSDVYVEYFHEIYLQQIEQSIKEYCE